MGRELKRVALDFSWELNVPWKGYINPYCSQRCTACDGSGMNPETKKISDDWYDFGRTGARWCDKITQDEVEALIEAGRLYDFTHRWTQGEGWKPIEPPPVVTAEMVNEWSRHGLGHDSINHWVCTKARARRLGVYGDCHACNGEGAIWFNDRIKELNEKWYDDERYEPPAGEGWQIWETVSKGSPITPVFPTAEALIEHMVKDGWKPEAAESFVKGAGWSPSLAMIDGEIKRPEDGIV